MSNTRLSREHAGGIAQPTLADVLRHVADDPSLTARQRQDLASALRTLAKALARPLAELPAHPGELRARLKGFAPAMAGLSERRWHNVLSLVRRALQQVGIKPAAGRRGRPFAPAWAALLVPLTLRDGRAGLSRLARYCSDQGIHPGEVDDTTFAALLVDLETVSLRNSPRRVQRSAILVWNRMVANRPEWPQRPVAVPSYRHRYSLPWGSFPASLRADVDAYLDHLAGKDLLAELDFRPLRQTSIDCKSRELRAFLSALVVGGRDPASLRTLADAVAVDAAKLGLRVFLDCAADKSTAQAGRMAAMLRTVARHWVKVEPAHLATLRAICKRLDRPQVGMTVKNRTRLRQFDDPASVRALLCLPEKLVTAATRAGPPTRELALQVQSAVAIEILLMLPLRLKNLTELDLERHLVRSRGGVLHLSISGVEVKNGVDIEAMLPASTARLIDLYLRSYRPLLLSGPSTALFPGAGGRPKTRGGLGVQIGRSVREGCGLLVNPHLFRHIAAKLYLDANPGGYGVVQKLHSHNTMNTTTRYYCGAETTAAVEHFDAHVLKLRSDATVSDRRRTDAPATRRSA